MDPLPTDPADDAARVLRGEYCWVCTHSTLRGELPSHLWCWTRGRKVDRDDWCPEWLEREPLR